MIDALEKRLYVPVSHPDTDMFRVPVWVSDDEVAISLGNNTFRYYKQDNVPHKVKSLLTMVHAFQPSDRPPWATNPTNAYMPIDPRQKDIGWRVTHELYILVLDGDFLRDCYVKGAGSG
jgi:hypothetical protein